ncbi:hypothetical protein GCM10007112_02150 [Vulcanisaeta souniana JCM 11219]|uniref:Uncharacterized protein n=1 Tax=Vulcanisaeta souniana JCM 11219 TaxID=1293586 RepID=A0A830E446_9CREN|nr:hypothetical protein GCM10007112_02150 [Vulcanisaeta souniana JCM 11219]
MRFILIEYTVYTVGMGAGPYIVSAYVVNVIYAKIINGIAINNTHLLVIITMILTK